MPHFPVILIAHSPTLAAQPGRGPAVARLEPSEFHSQPMAGRNTGARTLTRAESDIEAISGWLAKYTDNRNTFDAYKRDAERILAWAGAQGKGLADLMAEDLVGYGSFLRAPSPLEDWCLVKVPRYLEDGSDNPDWRTVQRPPRFLADGSLNGEWRPFVGALTPAAAGQSLTVLFGMFEYLCGVGYLAGNPLRASRKRGAKPRHRTVERYLEEDLWLFVLDHLEAWPRETPRKMAHYHRTRFLVRILQMTGLRRFELAKATTADIRRKDGAFWLHVEGKGDVVEDIPLTSAAMHEIGLYRMATGRPALPDPTKPEPLLMDITGAGRPVSVKTIHAELKVLFASALQACSDPYQVEKLRACSAHWLRHTTASHAISKGLSLLQTRDLLRHASVQTTEIYIGTDSARLHADLEQIQK